MLYKLDIMEIDGIYDHNVKIPLTFTYNVLPKILCNHHIYNGCGLSTRDNVLNQCKNPLKACEVAGGLN